ncbi:DNA-processing protein DprA [Neorhodopirellula lusitana]|uniref:DNA-processing protein DprA n=1 Tax=Neorhodopirellula lusitana TaxID=445327 RepID=UPI00384C14C9
MSEELFIWQEEQIDLEAKQTAPPSIDINKIDPLLRDRLQLCLLPGLGPRSLSVLFQVFGSASEVLRASNDALQRVPGVGPKLAHTIRTATDHVDVEGLLNWCDQNNVDIVQPEQPDVGDDLDVSVSNAKASTAKPYPTSLQELDDAPPILFVRGQWEPRDVFSIAIVGTRHATPYGLQQTKRLVRDLASSSVTIISGLARGIDTAAHRAALEAGGRTIAFLGGGLGQMYPPENAGLADEISQSGAVFSEYSPMSKPRGGMFPQRNRLIAAASLATLVIEAPQRSGALITARLASELGRGVGALPGPVNSRASSGCHELIRDGGTLVAHVDDVLELLGPFSQPVNCPTTARTTTQSSANGNAYSGESPLNQAEREVRNGAELSLNEVETTVLDLISTTGTAIDEIVASLELPVSRVSSVVSILEMKRLIRRLSSQYVSRI